MLLVHIVIIYCVYILCMYVVCVCCVCICYIYIYIYIYMCVCCICVCVVYVYYMCVYVYMYVCMLYMHVCGLFKILSNWNIDWFPDVTSVSNASQRCNWQRFAIVCHTLVYNITQSSIEPLVNTPCWHCIKSRHVQNFKNIYISLQGIPLVYIFLKFLTCLQTCYDVSLLLLFLFQNSTSSTV